MRTVCVCPSVEGEVKDDQGEGGPGGNCGEPVTANHPHAQKSRVNAPNTPPLPEGLKWGLSSR